MDQNDERRCSHATDAATITVVSTPPVPPPGMALTLPGTNEVLVRCTGCGEYLYVQRGASGNLHGGRPALHAA